MTKSVNRNKMKARAKALKRYLKGYPNATEEELKAWATGFNMGFKYKAWKYAIREWREKEP